MEFSAKQIAAFIQGEIIGDENKRTKLIQAGQERLKLYSWEKAARETENVYLKTLEEHAKLSSPGKAPV